MQIVGWTGGALVLGSVLMLLAWWAVVALVCRLGRQLLPLRASGASRRAVAAPGVLPVEEAERAGQARLKGSVGPDMATPPDAVVQGHRPRETLRLDLSTARGCAVGRSYGPVKGSLSPP